MSKKTKNLLFSMLLLFTAAMLIALPELLQTCNGFSCWNTLSKPVEYGLYAIGSVLTFTAVFKVQNYACYSEA